LLQGLYGVGAPGYNKAYKAITKYRPIHTSRFKFNVNNVCTSYCCINVMSISGE